MAFTFREDKGSDLTPAEVDENFREVDLIKTFATSEANRAEEARDSAETTLALVSGTIGLPAFTEPGAPLVVNSSGTGVNFGAGPALYAGSNLADLPNKAVARGNLLLGSAATRDVGGNIGDALVVGQAFGLGSTAPLISSDELLPVCGFYQYEHNIEPHDFPGAAGTVISTRRADAGGSYQIILPDAGPGANNVYYRLRVDADWLLIYMLYSTRNTTVDSNGFIKHASPIIKLFIDKIEKTDDLEIADTDFERIDIGVYKLTNAPLLSRDGWYIETPKDRNGNVYFTLDYEENDGTLTIRTYEPDYSTGRATNGAPVDILDGRFVSLRFEEDLSLYPAPEAAEGAADII